MTRKPSIRHSPDPLELANGVHSAAIHVLRKLRAVDIQTGLTAPKLSALSVIVFAGPITLGKLAQAEQVTPPTITRLVKDLESEGLVKRTTPANDRRVTIVQATATGRKRLHAGRLRRVTRLSDWVRTLSRHDRVTLTRALAILESFTQCETKV